MVTGFLAGIAVHIVVSQLPSLFGIARGAGDLVGQALAITSNLTKLNPFATAIGLGVLAIMLLAERISAHIPGALLGIALATLVVWPSTSRVAASLSLVPCQEDYLAWPYRHSTICGNSHHWQ